MNDDYIIYKGDYKISKSEIIQDIYNIADNECMDLNNITTNQFNYILSKVGSKYFKNTDILYIKSCLPEKRVDIDALIKLCNIYLDFCYKYNFVVSVGNFCNLVYIETDIIYAYSNYNITDKQYKLYKMLNNTREDYIKNKLIDSNNVVGAIAVANSEFGWSNNQQQGTTTINILSADNLPGLVASLQNKGLQPPTQAGAVPLPTEPVNYHE